MGHLPSMLEDLDLIPSIGKNLDIAEDLDKFKVKIMLENRASS